MNVSGLRVLNSEWTAKPNNSAELVLDVVTPSGDFRLSFDFDEQQLVRMVKAYCGLLPDS
jgi:hypothetical protein